MQPIVLIIIMTLLGAAWGSFLSAWIKRFEMGKSVLAGRSKCLSCHAVLAWYDLVPLVSYVVLGGRCRRCRAAISPRYFFVEFANALFFGATAAVLARGILFFGVGVALALCALVFLSMIFFFELYYGIVWSGLLVAGSAGVLLGNIILGVPVLELILGAVVGGGFFFVQWLISRGRWVGEGDIWIGLFMGFLLGWQRLILALLLGYVGGALVVVILLALKKISRHGTIQFGSFLAVGTWVAWLWGAEIIEWYFQFLR